MVLEDIPPAEPSFSDYTIDYLLGEYANSYYATIYNLIDGLCKRETASFGYN